MAMEERGDDRDAMDLETAWTHFQVDNLLVRIHFIIVMIRWTGLAPLPGFYQGTSDLTRA